MTDDDRPFPRPRPAEISRTTQLLLVGVIGAAFVGYVVGVGRPGAPAGPPAFGAGAAPRGRAVGDVQPAVTYGELRHVRLGPNRDWRNDVRALVAPASRAPAAGADTDPLLRQASLARRAERRAYNGAPPAIPHSIEQRSAASCLACHGAPLRIGEATASMIPHARLTACTQCHVEAAPSAGMHAGTSADGFRGLAAPSGGDRAWTGAPPVVPHSTLMRSDCLACHGPSGPDGMRTTHPERRSCLQCHAPSAVLDQVPAVAVVTAP